jgi:hypothetical protein
MNLLKEVQIPNELNPHIWTVKLLFAAGFENARKANPQPELVLVCCEFGEVGGLVKIRGASNAEAAREVIGLVS